MCVRPEATLQAVDLYKELFCVGLSYDIEEQYSDFFKHSNNKPTNAINFSRDSIVKG
jgi:hypothetical protein